MVLSFILIQNRQCVSLLPPPCFPLPALYFLFSLSPIALANVLTPPSSSPHRGKTRLAKWYAPYNDEEKVKVKGEVCPSVPSSPQPSTRVTHLTNPQSRSTASSPPATRNTNPTSSNFDTTRSFTAGTPASSFVSVSMQTTMN